MTTPKPDICTCKVCRQSIRQAVAQVLRSERRWIGFYTLVYCGSLGWIPTETIKAILQEMVMLGTVLEIYDEQDGFPRYLHFGVIPRCRPSARKRGSA